MENRKFVTVWAVVLLGTAMAVPGFLSAYKPDTAHRGLAAESIKFFEYHYPERSFTHKEAAMIKQGSVDEDERGKYLHHFYDPVYDRGLGSYSSALSWAQDTIGQAVLEAGVANLNVFSSERIYELDTPQTWEKAIYEYVYGDKDRALYALGHILHLVQDMAVPAHTRNDPHPPNNPSPYEGWTDRFNERNIVVADKLISTTETPMSENALSEHLISLAAYSNAKFFSNDTTPDNGEYNLYNTPEYRGEKEKVITLSSGVTQRFVTTEYKGKQVEIARVRKKFDPTTKTITKKFFLKDGDNLVLSNYWTLLSKKAVSHGAGVIKLFFDKVEEERRTHALRDANITVAEALSKDRSRLASMAAQRGTELTLGAGEKVADGVVHIAGRIKDGVIHVARKTRQGAESAAETVVDGWNFVRESFGDFAEENKESLLAQSGTAEGDEADNAEQGEASESDAAADPAKDESNSPEREQGNTPQPNTDENDEPESADNADQLAAIQAMLDKLREDISALARSRSLASSGSVADTSEDTGGSTGSSNTSAPSSSGSGSGGSSGGANDDGDESDGPVLAIGDGRDTDSSTNLSATSSTASTSPDTSDDTASSTPASATTTPDGTASSTAPQGHLVINEVGWSGTHEEDSDEWLELYNPSDDDVPLDGYRLANSIGTLNIELQGTVPARGFFVLERGDDDVITTLEADQVFAGRVRLSPGKKVVLELANGSSTVDQTALSPSCVLWRGCWPGGLDPAPSEGERRRSMERHDPFAPGDDPDNWGDNIEAIRNGKDRGGHLIHGTPGRRNGRRDLINNGLTIEEDLTVRAEDNPHLINGVLKVASTSSVTIEAGSVIKSTRPAFYDFGSLHGRYNLLVKGRLLVNGTEEEPVVMTGLADRDAGKKLLPTPVKPGKIRWGGVRFDGQGTSTPLGTSTSTPPHIIQNTEFKGADTALLFTDTAAELEGVSARGGNGFIYARASNIAGKNLEAENIARRFVYAEWGSRLSLDNANFRDGSWWERRHRHRARGDMVVVARGSALEAEGLKLSNASTSRAIHTGEESTTDISDSYITVPGGIATGHDNKRITVRNSRFVNSGISTGDRNKLTVENSCFVSNGEGRGTALDLNYEPGVNLSGNLITGYRGTGVRMDWPHRLDMRHNIIRDNGTGAYLLNNSSRYSILNNVIEGNSEYGFEDGDWGESHWYDQDVTGNYWGDASGPNHKHNKGGKGDKINETSDPSPWLAEPPVVLKGDGEVGADCAGFEGVEVKEDAVVEARRDIVLNEIYPNAKSGEPSLPEHAEWIELYNNGEEPVDVAGWEISEMSGRTEKRYKIVGEGAESGEMNTISGRTTIPAKGYLVLTFRRLYYSVLNNGGDTVSFYDAFGRRLDSHAYPETDKGKSHARIPDGTGEWIDPVPTPGAPNELVSEPASEPASDEGRGAAIAKRAKREGAAKPGHPRASSTPEKAASTPKVADVAAGSEGRAASSSPSAATSTATGVSTSTPSIGTSTPSVGTSTSTASTTSAAPEPKSTSTPSTSKAVGKGVSTSSPPVQKEPKPKATSTPDSPTIEQQPDAEGDDEPKKETATSTAATSTVSG